jgi:DNA-binding transcriptional LysR family regulator
VKLFDRRPNKLVLTHRGRAVLKDVSQILDLISKLQTVSHQSSSASAEKLTIGLGSDLPKFLAPQIASFTQRHPQLQLTIVSKPFQTLSLLLGGTVDVAIGWFPYIPRMVQKKTLFNSQVHLIVPNGHSLTKKRRISLEDTAQNRIVLHPSNASVRRVVEEAFYRSGVEIGNVLEVGTCESIVEYVRRGVGIGFVHDICLPIRFESEVRSYNMSDKLGTIEVSIIYRESIAKQPSYHALIESLSSPRISLKTRHLATGTWR